MYPLVELLTGLLFFACFYRLRSYDRSAEMVRILRVDHRSGVHRSARADSARSVVNYTGFAMGLVLSLFTKPSDGTALWLAGITSSSSLRRARPFVCRRPFRRRCGKRLCCGSFRKLISGCAAVKAWALGDVKMMLLVGAFLGVKRTLLTILAGSLLGSMLGIVFILARRKDIRLRIAVWNVSRNGGVAGRFFRHAARELVPVAA